ncbi:MAG: prepilin peptidase [Patescibacteria group bacterium]|jgi:prepilin signal peptidase PulO-like enzyme (type II secretory pathway)
MWIVAALFGLFIGSFLNVVNLRFGKWKSIATSRSNCVHCKHTLSWFDLIPVLSFGLLGGKCRYCHKPISIQYPIIELLSAILAGLIWWHYQPESTSQIILAILTIIFGYIFLLMSIEDVKQMEVHDELFWSAIVIGVIIAVFTQHSLVSLLLGVASAAGLLFLLTTVSKERWMGWGDVLVAVPVGIILGYPLGLLWILTGFWVGAIYGVGLMALKIKKRTDPVPFLPILLASFVIVLLWGDRIVNWYLK